jgi:signal transduction histidine kinase
VNRDPGLDPPSFGPRDQPRDEGGSPGLGVVRESGGGAPEATALPRTGGSDEVAELLRRAVLRTREGWSREFSDAVEEGELTRSLRRLAEVLARPDAGNDQELRSEDPALVVLRRRLLERLRGDFIREIARSAPDPVRAQAGLDRLIRFEEVAEALEPDWENRMSVALSGPEARDLLAEVGHDLRSPLTSVLFLSDALRTGQSGEVNAHQGKQLALIYSASLTMLAMVNDFIELGTRGRKAGDRRPEGFLVEDVIEPVCRTVQPMAEERGLDLRVEWEEGVGFRRGHPIPLSRVLLNLLTNAVKYSDEGEVSLRIGTVGEDRVRFSVEDTGPGLPEGDPEGIFRPFVPAVDQGGYRFSSSGLGLTIVRKLLKGMDSELEVYSRPGKGSRFSFVLDLPEIQIGGEAG